jgi:hypothetical protein
MTLFRNSSPGALTLKQSIEQARKHLAARSRQISQARDLAAQGRGGDTEVAHVALGEMVLPRELQSPEVLIAIQKAAAPYNVPLEMLSVGHIMNNINPATGAPEFSFALMDGLKNWASGLFGRDADAAGGAPSVPEATGDYAHDFPGANAQLQGYDVAKPIDVETNSLFNGPINVGPQPMNPSHVNSFFDANRDRITALADEMNTSPNLLLGLAAGESNWGRPQGKNNLFGFSESEVPLDYQSPEASIDAFRKSQWYSRLQNKANANDFIDELLNTQDGKKRYNSVNPDYRKYVGSLIDTVNRRLPIWEQQAEPPGSYSY